jgi:hypothetical protein
MKKVGDTTSKTTIEVGIIPLLLKERWLREAQTGWLVQATDYR